MSVLPEMPTNTSFLLNETGPSPPPQTEPSLSTISNVVNTVLGLIGISGFIGNLIIAVVILKRKKLQTPTNWFVFNLAICDLAIITLIIPMSIVIPVISWPFLLIGCKYLIMPVMEHFAGVCVLTHTAISFARYAVLSGKIKFNNISVLKALICAIWLVSFLVLSVPLMGLLGEFKLQSTGGVTGNVTGNETEFKLATGNKRGNGTEFNLVEGSETGKLICYLDWISHERRQIYRVCVFFLTYVIPMVTTGYSYYRIHKIVVKSLHRVDGFLPLDVVCARRRKTRKLDKLLTVMYVMFGMTTLPLQLFMFLVDFHIIPSRFHGATLIFNIFVLIFYLQILVNPLVLLYMGEDYRKGLAELTEGVRKMITYIMRKISAYCALNQRRASTLLSNSGDFLVNNSKTSKSMWEASEGREKNRLQYNVLFFSPALNEILQANMKENSTLQKINENSKLSSKRKRPKSRKLTAEISLGDEYTDLRSSLRRKSGSLRRHSVKRNWSGNSRSGSCREKRPNSIGRSTCTDKHDLSKRPPPCTKKVSNSSTDITVIEQRDTTLRRPPYIKKDSDGSADGKFIEHGGSTPERLPYMKVNSSSSLDEDYKGKRLSNLQRSYMRIDSSSSLDDVFPEKTLSSFRRISYRKMDSCSSLDEVDSPMATSCTRLDSNCSSLRFDSNSSSLDEIWNESRQYNSRNKKVGIIEENTSTTFEKFRLSDVQEDYASDKRQSEIECMVQIQENIFVNENLQSTHDGVSSGIPLDKKKGKSIRVISFIENGVRVLIPACELENLFYYNADDADDTYLHLPDQDDYDEYKETII